MAWTIETMGSGLWKLNVSVLEEPDYFRLISDFWSGWRHRMPAFASLSDWWEMGKSRIKGLTIDYCCRRSCYRSNLISGYFLFNLG